MLNVALTGNVAAGKSTVAELLERWGATVIDADRLVREAQAPGSPVLAEITRRFGRSVLAPDGSLDRAALRVRILADEAARESLNAIVHPEVRRRRDALAQAARAAGDLVVVSDIPLLFEASDPAAFDLVILVDAPPEVRRSRLRARGLAEDEADRLMDVQLPTDAKRSASHFILDNAGTLAELEGAAREAWLAIRRSAARRALGSSDVERLSLVARQLADLTRGPAGTAARYVDAGLAVHLLAGEPARRAEATALAEQLGLKSAELVGDIDGAEAHQAWQRVRPDATVVCAAPRVPWAPDAWTHAPHDPRPGAELDVRPWRDVVARVREATPVDRETFSRRGEAPATPRRDLFFWLDTASGAT